MAEVNGVRRNKSKMVNSFVWTPEEAKYLKAVLRWQASASSDDEKRRRLGTAAEEDAARRRHQQVQEKPAGEFRVLVVGGRGTGKTAILTRVSIPQATPYPLAIAVYCCLTQFTVWPRHIPWRR